MKRVRNILCFFTILIMLLALLPLSTATADLADYDSNDFTKIRAFLNLPSAIDGMTNGQVLTSEYNQDDPSTWIGISWTDTSPMHVYYIGTDNEWSGINLAGMADFSDFKMLSYINISNNMITGVDVTGDTELDILNCGVNQITSLDVTGNPHLSYLNCRENLLTDLQIYGLQELHEFDFTFNKLTDIHYCTQDGDIVVRALGNGYVGLRTYSDEYSETIRYKATSMSKNGSLFQHWICNGEIMDYGPNPSFRAIGLELVAVFSGGSDPSVSPIVTQPAEPSVSPVVTEPVEPSVSPIVTEPAEPSVSPIVTVPAEPSVTPVVTPPAEPSVTPVITPPAEPSVVPTPEPTRIPTPFYVYEVIFDLDGGTKTAGDLKQMVGRGGDAVPPTVEKYGYHLVGWDSPYKNITGNTYPKAKWEKDEVYYQVEFLLNGGTQTGGGELIQTVQYGEAAVAPTVERNGYTFEAWTDTFSNIVGNMKIKALWKIVGDTEEVKYSLTYDLNGGEGEAPTDDAKYQEGDTAALADGTDLTREGYLFAGWSYEIDGDPITEEEIEIVEDTTLYAVWDEVEASELEEEVEEEPVVEPTQAPPAEEVINEVDVDDIPKTGEATGMYTGIVIFVFASGIVAFEIIKKRKHSRNME